MSHHYEIIMEAPAVEVAARLRTGWLGPVRLSPLEQCGSSFRGVWENGIISVEDLGGFARERMRTRCHMPNPQTRLWLHLGDRPRAEQDVDGMTRAVPGSFPGDLVLLLDGREPCFERLGGRQIPHDDHPREDHPHAAAGEALCALPH